MQNPTHRVLELRAEFVGLGAHRVLRLRSIFCVSILVWTAHPVNFRMDEHAMGFMGATDRLAGKVTHEELAKEIGCSVQGIRQARLDPSHLNYRKPPDGWEKAVARLAKRRGAELEDLARQLEGAGE